MKITLNLTLFLCAIFFNFQTSLARRTKPLFVDAYDDVFEDFTTDEQQMNSFKEQEEDVGDAQIIDNQKVISENEDAWCIPRPIPVRIPVPSHFVIRPTYVILNRCLGRASSIVEKCAPRKREKVIVQYRVLTDVTRRKESEVMYNDLECTSRACITKKEDCNSKTQTFKNCYCNCMLNNTYCESINRSYDPSTCQCTCKTPVECDLYMEWNPVTCRCECGECVKKMCRKAHLKLDKRTCMCETDIQGF